MLESVGLTTQAETVYLAMLQNPFWGVEELSLSLAMPEADIRDALNLLADRALVRPAHQTGGLRAVSPQAGLLSLLAEAEADLTVRQRQIEAARATISAMAAEHDNTRVRDEIVRLEGTQAARERLAELGPSVARECLSFTVGAEMAAEALEASKPHNQAALERGVQMRNVYQESVRNDPANLAYAKWMASLGGHSRTVPTVPLRMVIIDREVALIALDLSDSRKGALEVRSPSMIAALCVLFEQVWDYATPFGELPKVNDSGLSPQEQALLRLLDSGHTDESAGRKLGLSARTVRRVVAELTDRMGVESRFQAGAEAVRRGWL